MRFRLQSGLSLHYASRGVGPTLVLLHPVGLPGDFWNPVVALLEADFRLIVPDLRGHGSSDFAGAAFSLEELAVDIVELVRGIGGGRPVVVVGCSMGGMIAQGFAVQAPELAAGIVVANASHMRNDKGRAVMQQRALEAMGGMPCVLDVTLSRWFDEAFQAEAPQTVARTREWLLSADAIVHATAWLAIRDLDFGPRLQHVTLPALVVAGSRDRSVPPEVVRQVAAALPNSRYREIDAGHLTPLERPQEFAAVLREFAASLPTAPVQAAPTSA